MRFSSGAACPAEPSGDCMRNYGQQHPRFRHAAYALMLAALSSLAQSQAPRADTGIEEISILRSVRLSRVDPTDFCAPSRTGFSRAAMEDRYDFKSVATAAASGEVTGADGPRVGTLHACFGPTADAAVVNFYAEGSVRTVAIIGRGSCRTTKVDFPEAGISVATCQLDLSGLPADYVGGYLTTNSILSHATLGPESEPLGYTQTSIATIRLWKKRPVQQSANKSLERSRDR